MKKIIILFLMFITAFSSTAHAVEPVDIDKSLFGHVIKDANTGKTYVVDNSVKMPNGQKLFRAVDQQTAARTFAIMNSQLPSINRALSRGIAGVAIADALLHLGYAAVDYLLDPANNQVKINNNVNADFNYVYEGMDSNGNAFIHQNADSACTSAFAARYDKNWTLSSCKTDYRGIVVVCGYNASEDRTSCYNAGIRKPRTTPAPTQQSVPFSDVANKIYNDAKQDKPNARKYADDALNHDVQTNQPDITNNITNQFNINLNRTDPHPETAPQTNNTSTNNTYNTTNNTYNTINNPVPEKFELPGFCSWAKFMCDTQTEIKTNTEKTAVETEKSRKELEKQTEQDKTFFDEVRENYDKAKAALIKVKDDFFALFEKPSDENNEIDVDDNFQQNIDTNISMAAQCPAPIVYEADYHGIKSKFGVSDFTPFCNILESIIRPILIAMASFSAVLIIAGIGVKENG